MELHLCLQMFEMEACSAVEKELEFSLAYRAFLEKMCENNEVQSTGGGTNSTLYGTPDLSFIRSRALNTMSTISLSDSAQRLADSAVLPVCLSETGMDKVTSLFYQI